MGHIRDLMERNMAVRGRALRIVRLPTTARPQAATDLRGFAARYLPGDMEGPIQQGDRRILVLADEMGALGSPTTGMVVIEDGKQEVVMGVNPMKEADDLVAFTLWVRGR